MADEAEAGLERNKLCPAFRAIKRMQGGPNQENREASINKSDGSACRSTKETLDRWREYHGGMLNHAAVTPCTDLDDEASMITPATDIPTDAPTLDEVIRRLKNGRAAGLDDITPELLKCTEVPISEALHQLFLKVWSTGRVNSEWREGVIVSLYKSKGPRSECSSYRSITLLSVLGKVLSHVLLNRLEPLLTRQRRPQQSGFIRCRSTMKAIPALRLLAEIHREFGRPLHVAYIEINAEFDSVDRKALWKALKLRTHHPSYSA